MNSPDKTTFVAHINRAWPADSWRDANVVLGVSSGPDSVAMLHAMLALKAEAGGRGSLFVAHLNHALRGEAADADQEWLAALCRHWQVPLESGRVDPSTLTGSGGGGLEAAARSVRYQFLRDTAERLGARFVAVAHTGDDQVETVLHRIVRGTGLHGLAGMAVARPLSPGVTLIRPMLSVSRAEVLAYLRDMGQTWREDESNVDRQWTRNRLRHELLPLLRAEYNPGVDGALLRLAAHARDVQQLVRASAAELIERYVAIEWLPGGDAAGRASRVRIDSRQLAKVPPVLISEVCRAAWLQAGWPQQAMGLPHWQQVAELIQGLRTVPANLPGGFCARPADGHWVVIEQQS